MGKEAIRLLKFTLRYLRNGEWSSYGNDAKTVRAINRLVGLGFLEVNEYRQFRLANVKSEDTP